MAIENVHETHMWGPENITFSFSPVSLPLGPLGNKAGNGVERSEYSSSFPSTANDGGGALKREGVGLRLCRLDGDRAGRDTITGLIVCLREE